MKITEERPKKNFENILPLVNVVFLLLIFFMLAGSFSKPDFYKVKTPVADNDDPVDRKLVTIIMNTDGNLAIENDSYSDAGLEAYIRSKTSGDNKLPLVQLKADRGARSDRLLEVMEILAVLGVESLHLLTQQSSK